MTYVSDAVIKVRKAVGNMSMIVLSKGRSAM